MPTREARVAEFDTSVPPGGCTAEILCEDTSGTYVLPYACTWTDGEWRNSDTLDRIEARVLGWRELVPGRATKQRLR
jgi:hypothetical protein